MKNWLFQTNPNGYGSLIARLALGLVMLPHGLQKAFGLFGGPGFEGTMGFLTGMGIPAAVAALVIIGESVGAVALILGFCTRFCAAALAVIMLGAIILVHGASGFFAPSGYEYHLLAIGLGLVLVIQGGGAWSLDMLLNKKK
ncbi:MAG: DoxX family protein [Candidatus Peribacteraceae bacterium]|nr:DoxX family protein [Candidatus Peribacteraceae bacterium]